MRIISAVLVSLFLLSNAHAESRISKATESSLNFMKSVFESVYAPAPWKKKFDNWDIDAEHQKGLDNIKQKSDGLSVHEGRRILMDFIYSMRDYHVSIGFDSTEVSTLPFTVRSAEGRHFIVHIDTDKLGETSFPFSEGDEVITFGGRPVADVVNELKVNELNVSETDQAIAELSLTRRRASRGFLAPRGPVAIGVKKKGETDVLTRQLIWAYTPEKIAPMQPQVFDGPFVETKEPAIESPMMTADLDLSLANPHGVGDKDGYLPDLGDAIWNSTDEDLFRSYIYKAENGEVIGVIRIPGYVVKDYEASLTNFAKIIERMEKVTDKLVIDQLNNPGGSVFYLYALASTLSPNPLSSPRHRMSVTPKDVKSCLKQLKEFEEIDTDEKAVEKVGKTIAGYPVSLQFVEFYREYCRIYIEDWNAGNSMTRPYWIAGVDQINPYANTYSKPILILINELDFSGGDFFPTIMQDNKRATIMGVRTAGAGGYVLNYSFPNLLGVDSFRVTQSLAYRVSQNPIENLGVTPDIDLALTANDRQNKYEDYIKAVQETVKGLK